MILIVEGIDGAGKTTLCSRISELLGWPVYKPVGNPLQHGMSTVESQGHDRGAIGVLTTLVGPWGGIVMDRSFPSEYAYSGALGRDYDVDAVLSLDKQVSEVNHLMILLNWPDGRAGYEHAKKRGMTELGKDDFLRVWSRYLEFEEISAMRIVRINAELGPEQILDEVFESIERIS